MAAAAEPLPVVLGHDPEPEGLVEPGAESGATQGIVRAPQDVRLTDKEREGVLVVRVGEVAAVAAELLVEDGAARGLDVLDVAERQAAAEHRHDIASAATIAA